MSITDRIRKQLEQPDALTLEAIEPLAELYGQETQQANARLAECIQLLRKGLRSEAIQRASMKPNLLDWCARLDFPEIDDWLEILKFYGIPVPPLLDRAAAQQLQEAIVDEQPLEELLRQHRQLAIGKAPLSWRLKVLRRLAQIDSVNSVWREDQEQWEIIRLKQIPTELARAIESESLGEIQDLCTELNRSNWVAMPPKELCKQAASAANSLVYKDQCARLQRLIDKLHAAYSEGDETTAEKHFQTYSAHVAQMISPPPAEQTQRAEPAIEWLTECMQAREKVQLFELNSAALENLLQSNPTLANLERAYYDVASLQMGIDPILEQRYETKTAELKQYTRRRLQMYFAAVAATTVTLLFVLGLWQWNRGRQQAKNETVAKLQVFLDTQEFDAAEGLLRQLSADDSPVAKAPEVIALAEKIRAKQATESERRKRTEELIATAEREDPSTIDINQVILAEKEAKTPEEIIRIKRVRASWESYERSISDMHAASIKKAVTNFDSQLLAIEQLPLDEIKDSEIDSIVIELKKLPGEFPKALNKDALLKPAQDRAVAIKDNTRKRRSEIALRQRLTIGIRNASSLASFTTEMKDYADKLPGDKLAKQFADALIEQPLWQQIEQWNTWCDSINQSAIGGLSGEELTNLSSSWGKLNKNLQGLPGGDIGNEMSQLAADSESRKGILKSLLEQFSIGATGENSHQLSQIVTVIEPGKPGKRRFMHFQARRSSAAAIGKMTDFSKITLPIISDESLQTEEIDFKGKLTVFEEPRATIGRLGEHFQQKDFLENWDSHMIAALGMIVADKNLDATLKELLLEAVIKAAGDGSIYLKESLAPALRKLGETREERNLWYVVAEPSFQLSGELQDVLRKGVHQARGMQASFMAKLAQASKVRFTWVGAVLLDNADKVEGWLAKADLTDGLLFMVLPTPESREVGQLTKVGRVQNKKIVLNTSPENLMVGRPLFWIASSLPSKLGASVQTFVK